MTQEWQEAYVLHRRPWRETSLWLEIFSCQAGKVALLSKGARRGKANKAGLLQPFQPLALVWRGRGDLPTLIGVEPLSTNPALTGQALFCGFYVNELLSYLLHRHDPHPQLFQRYQSVLADLIRATDLEASLRFFELDLLAAIGYGLILDREIISNCALRETERYRYELDSGPVCDSRGWLHGATLLELSQRRLASKRSRQEAKRLLRQAIDYRLEGKQLNSRSLFLPRAKNEP